MKYTVLMRVWPDGTHQDVDEEPYEWMSDDYEVLSIEICEQCGEPQEFCNHD